MKTNKNLAFIFFTAVAVATFSLAVIGGFHSYSPVPLWDDMWNGYVNFYIQSSDGDTSVWWSQHNEHRIVLARIFYWLDIRFFAGSEVFLLLLNYFFAIVLVALLWHIWRQASNKTPNWFGSFMIIWLFSWIQRENFYWTLQSQFWLAQLLPLLAFYLLFLSQQRHPRYFYPATVVGILAVGSMANGLLVLPLMVVYAIFARINIVKTITLAVLAVVCFALYFHQYEAISFHGSLGAAIREMPVDLLQYILLYLGGPLYFFLGKGNVAQGIAMLGSVILIVVSAWILFSSLRRLKTQPLLLALIMELLFLGGSAVAAGGGRVIFGVEQALSSRYMTPALIVWAVFMLVLLTYPRVQGFMKSPVAALVFAGLAMAVFWRQLPAMKAIDNHNMEKKVAVLAVEMGIRDDSRLRMIFSDPQRLLDITKTARDRDIAVFGLDPYQGLSEKIGKAMMPTSNNLCRAHADNLSELPQQQDWQNINGWIFDTNMEKSPKMAYVLNKDNVVIGAVLVGYRRQDIADSINPKAILSGFSGYIRGATPPTELLLYSPDIPCQAKVSLPRDSD